MIQPNHEFIDFFDRIFTNSTGSLYRHHGAEGLWVGFVARGTTPESITLEKSWSYNIGSYVFCEKEPADHNVFLDSILKHMNNQQGPCYESDSPMFVSRYFFWCDCSDRGEAVIKNCYLVSHVNGGSGISQFNNPLFINNTSLKLEFIERVSVHPTAGNQFLFNQHGDQGIINFLSYTNSSVEISYIQVGIQNLVLALHGKESGSFKFDTRAKLNDKGLNFYPSPELPVTQLPVGLRYHFFYNEAGKQKTKSQHFGITGTRDTDTPFRFQCVLNPLFPLAKEKLPTAFRFGILPDESTDININLFKTPFRSDFGHPIMLKPIVFSSEFRLEDNDYEPYWTPGGPFQIQMAKLSERTKDVRHLLCGLSGTETIGFRNGHLLNFVSYQPALAPIFPVPALEEQRFTSGDATIPELLQSHRTTSWISVQNNQSQENVYVSQPEDAVLFKTPEVRLSPPHLPSPLIYDQQKTSLLTAEHLYPLVPYVGMQNSRGSDFDDEEATQFEYQVIHPVRKRNITGLSNHAVITFPTIEGDLRKTTTPQGLLVEADINDNWESILLAQIANGTGTTQYLKLGMISSQLKSAFLTNQLFLVITNPLDPFVGQFMDEIDISEWPFHINNKKADNKYGNYQNVIILKFCEGTLKDLVEKPQNWTNADTFNKSDNGELFALSAWLREYFEDALTQKDPFYALFNHKIQQASWTGILALKVDIKQKAMPSDLKVLNAGMEKDLFHAHHIGINVNIPEEVNGKIVLEKDSSLFALVHYMDPIYEQVNNFGNPIPVYTEDDFDFKVLSVRALFFNSEIQDFTSEVQLTVKHIFEESVNEVISQGDQLTVSSGLKSIFFTGRRENHGETNLYIFNTPKSNKCQLESSVFHHVEISGASIDTVQIANGPKFETRFNLMGFMDFQNIKGLDAFSYGSLSVEDASKSKKSGLPFSKQLIRLVFDESTMKRDSIWMDTSDILITPEQVQPRKESLIFGLPLKFKRFVSFASSGKLPSELGYIPLILVNTAISVPQPLDIKGPWSGFEFELDLGNAGMLAADTLFTTRVLLAWTKSNAPVNIERPKYNFFLGLQLPGGGEQGKLFNLQGVIKMGIGDIVLTADPSSGTTSYSMQFNNVGLQFLNFKFPPGGTMNFGLQPPPGATADQTNGLGWYANYIKDSTNPIC
ncbi:hypothetical protein [Paenibacillus sp. FSL R10-2734]|uniref:hypothetical protein n=1 Tax=Paenibacillus sp. FSL R10-2734 TaxID=2954691 RepID=UPI0030D75796